MKLDEIGRKSLKLERHKESGLIMSGECDTCGEHALECRCDIELIVPPSLPFDQDAKLFNCVDEETGQVIGEPYSFNEWIDNIKNISGINEELL